MGRRRFAARDEIRQVDNGVVGQKGHGEVGHLLAGLHHVQAAAYPGAGLAEDGQTLVRAPAAGDIHAHGAHPQRPAVAVVEAEERRRQGMLALLILQWPCPALVGRGRAALQYLLHHRLERFGFEAGQRVREAASEPPVVGDAVQAFHDVVDPGAAQFPVTDDDADRCAHEK